MLKPLTLCLLALALTSCSSVRSKQKLVKRGMNSIAAKNYLINEFTFTSNGFIEGFAKDSLQYLSKKEIRRRLSACERFFALIPDTTIEKDNRVDSIYSNPSKINYIKKHDLKTDNIHFPI